LYQQAALVQDSCNRAVNLAPDYGLYRDSRGVNKALLGQLGDARADFTAFVMWAQSYPNYADQVTLCRQWIQQLESGTNPFKPFSTGLRSQLINDPHQR